ncbi:uncharacterized protein ARMOST_11465 [Armillaria ostoyae]|uniref:Uncharacterized protein n=1 Tax=Armillaria ostoyae TaxID=47428 RepID=A0A284RH65_ARMOS|nr:uncharacterized protein ARMOST_11465 [Armillaria ostoyae]
MFPRRNRVDFRIIDTPAKACASTLSTIQTVENRLPVTKFLAALTYGPAIWMQSSQWQERYRTVNSWSLAIWARIHQFKEEAPDAIARNLLEEEGIHSPATILD